MIHHPTLSPFGILFRLKLIFAAALIFYSSSPCTAQTTPTNSPDDQEVIRVNTRLIAVPVFVSDSRGRFVSTLEQKDFAVRDNNRTVEISYFASGAERVGVVFALDASGSAREIAQQQADAAVSLLSQFGERSRFACLRFADRPELILPFTAERGQIPQAFNFPALRNRRTAIFDAALAAVRLYDFNDQTRTQTERRIIILLSDGLDTASSINFSTVIEEATRRVVSFYVLHLPVFAPIGGRLSPRPAVKGFRKLAEETGGRFFVLGNAEAALNSQAKPLLTPVFDHIAQDLRSQYMLGYYSHDDQVEHHLIDVNLTTSNSRRLRVNVLRKAYNINEETTVK